MRRMRSRSCARAVSGHAAAPPSRVMNSRRCMCSLRPWSQPITSEGHVVHHNKIDCRKVEMGQTRTSANVCGTTASPPEADFAESLRDLAEGPEGDIQRKIGQNP